MKEFYLSHPCTIVDGDNEFTSALDYYAHLLGITTMQASVTEDKPLLKQANMAKFQQNDELRKLLLSVSEEELNSEWLREIRQELAKELQKTIIICKEDFLIKTPLRDYPEDLYRLFCAGISMNPDEFMQIPNGSNEVSYDQYIMSEDDAVAAVGDIKDFYNLEDFDEAASAESDIHLVTKYLLRDLGYKEFLSVMEV